MKKVLLTTTAIIAIIGVTMMTGIKNDVHAQEVKIKGPMTLDISGHNMTLFGYWSDERDDQVDREFFNETVIIMHAKGTHDEGSLAGLEYGLKIKIETLTGGSSQNVIGLEEVWGYLKHDNFGELRLGDKDGAAGLGDKDEVARVMTVHLPTTAGTGGLDGYFTDFIGSFPVAFKVPNSEDSTKITYFIPEIGGEEVRIGRGKRRVGHFLEAGISYTPERNEGETVLRTNTLPSGVRNKDYIEAGLVYNGDIPLGKATALEYQIGANVSYFIQQQFTAATDTTPASRATDTRLNYQIGLKASYRGFTFGGGAILYDSDDPKDMGYSAGLGYQNGPVDVNVSFSMVQFDDDDNDSSPMVIMVGMTYTLTPGAKILGEVFYYNADDKDVVDSTGAPINALESGFGAILGLRVHF